jgi:hypothetical protein
MGQSWHGIGWRRAFYARGQRTGQRPLTSVHATLYFSASHFSELQEPECRIAARSGSSCVGSRSRTTRKRCGTTITTDGESHELTFPEQGYWSISDHPRRNKVDKIDKVLYEGGFGESLVVELFGEELDDFTANDHLEDYRREYAGDASTWIGRHQPTDEGSDDPENMVDWRVCYDIEMI